MCSKALHFSLVCPQYTPSAYLAEMKMNTEERLATITEMYPPTITELLDIATSSNHKVATTLSMSTHVWILLFYMYESVR